MNIILLSVKDCRFWQATVTPACSRPQTAASLQTPRHNAMGRTSGSREEQISARNSLNGNIILSFFFNN